jgi:hypothetical protein
MTVIPWPVVVCWCLGFDKESVACVCVSNAGEEKRMTAGFIKVPLVYPT